MTNPTETTLHATAPGAPRRASPRPLTAADFRLPAALFALSAVPVLGGVVRLASLAPGATVTPDDARFVAAPFPIAIHVVAATVFCLLGAFQFSAAFRQRWPLWHRRAGRVLAVFGLLAGVTGLWMTVAYPIPRGLQGPWLLGVRLAVGAGMITSIVLAWRRILQRDVAAHEAWMIRAYALGQGAGTQAVIMLPWILWTGDGLGPTRDLLMTIAWVLNVVIAEGIIHRRRAATEGARAPRRGAPEPNLSAS